jgi:Glycosyltransferase like family
MIAFGVAVTDDAQYRRCAEVGISRVAATSDLVMTRSGVSIQRAYNEMLEEATAHPDLEAVVLPHQDMRIAQDDFAVRIRSVLVDPAVGLVGASGGIGGRGLAWWDGAETVGHFGTELYGSIARIGVRPAATREVDAVDGTILILSAEMARAVRFDEAFAPDFHGYDVDLSYQVRAHGRRVVVADLWCVHEAMGKIGGRRGSWVRASLRFDRKWSAPPLGAPRRLGVAAPSEHALVIAEALATRARS